jgi:protein-disulfide isomerase
MKKILFRFFLLLVVLASAYSLFGIAHFKWMYHKVENPSAEFLTIKNVGAPLKIVEFINYGCGFCKELHPTVKELLNVRKDIEYVVRPISFGEGITNDLTNMALAAGLQDRFWEFNDAFLEYPEDEIPDDFIRELADLYGVDYERLMSDSKSEAVKKLADENSDALGRASLGSVPSFMINRHLYYVDERGVPDLKTMLDIVASAQNK